MADRHQIFTAVKNGDVNYINQLPQNSPELNLTESEGGPPLILYAIEKLSYRHWNPFGAQYVYTDIAKMLINKGCDVNIQDKYRRTALHIAAKNCYSDMVQLLLDHGADYNGTDKKGQTPLMMAVDYESSAMGYLISYKPPLEFSKRNVAEMLINRGCDVNIQDKDGRTALSIAARHGYIEIVELLLNSGSDPNIGESVVWESSKSFPIIKVLLDSESDPNSGFPMVSGLHLSYPIYLLRILLLHGLNRDVYPIIQNFVTNKRFNLISKNIKLIDLACLTGACPQSRLFSLYKDPDRTEILKDDPSKREWLENKISIPMSLQDLCRITIFKNLRPNKLKNVEKLPIPTNLQTFLRFNFIDDFEEDDDDDYSLADYIYADVEYPDEYYY